MINYEYLKGSGRTLAEVLSCFYICLEGLRETTNIFSQYSRCPNEVGTERLQNKNSLIFCCTTQSGACSIVC